MKKQLFLLWLRLKGINNKKLKTLVKEYINALNIKKTSNNTNKFCLGFIGQTGVGKTTVTNKILKNIPSLAIISSDQIRRIMEKQKITYELMENENFFVLIGHLIFKELLKKNINFIIDADLRKIKLRNRIEKITKAHKFQLLLIHITASKNIVSQRIQERKKQEPSHYLKHNIEHLAKTQEEVHINNPLPENIFYTINNDEKLNEQIKIVTKLLLNY